MTTVKPKMHFAINTEGERADILLHVAADVVKTLQRVKQDSPEYHMGLGGILVLREQARLQGLKQTYLKLEQILSMCKTGNAAAVIMRSEQQGKITKGM